MKQLLNINLLRFYLHVGTNDLGNTVTHSPRQIASNIQMLVSIIQKNLPDCRVTILSPLPCDEDIQGYPHARGIRSNAFLKIFMNIL